jgi:hypothetical protein
VLALVARQGCPAGQTSCTQTGPEGQTEICTDTQTDAENCGACGRPCFARPGSGISVSCVAGECLCDGAPACDHECPDFQTASHHCGGCNNWVSERRAS